MAGETFSRSNDRGNVTRDFQTNLTLMNCGWDWAQRL
ncbi:MAG: hypothetical protein ACI9KE_003673 [Polyangiales bacterium]|jgi:hypothetical protein